jgi:hypothetical protein
MGPGGCARSMRPRVPGRHRSICKGQKSDTRLIEFQMVALFQRTKDASAKKLLFCLVRPQNLNRLIYARRRSEILFRGMRALRRHKVIQFARTNWIRRKKPLVRLATASGLIFCRREHAFLQAHVKKAANLCKLAFRACEGGFLRARCHCGQDFGLGSNGVSRRVFEDSPWSFCTMRLPTNAKWRWSFE